MLTSKLTELREALDQELCFIRSTKGTFPSLQKKEMDVGLYKHFLYEINNATDKPSLLVQESTISIIETLLAYDIDIKEENLTVNGNADFEICFRESNYSKYLMIKEPELGFPGCTVLVVEVKRGDKIASFSKMLYCVHDILEFLGIDYVKESKLST